MHSVKKLITTALFLTIFTTPVFADVKQDSKAIKISGGEGHTLVLTKNNYIWACGDSEYYQLGIGNTQTDQPTLVRVYVPNDANYLQDINDISAGYKHSLALDANNLVWAWGLNVDGQLGDNTTQARYTPDVIYVDADASAGYDTGLSWQNALLDLQHALSKATKNTCIWTRIGI